MMSLRTRIFILVSLVVLLILGISLLLYFLPKKQAAMPGASSTPAVVDQSNFEQLPTGQTATQVPSGLPVKPQTSEEMIKNGVKALAKIFTERYGTYSSDNSFQNIRDVQELSSPDLWKVLNAKLSVPAAAGSFVGMTTQVLNTEITAWATDKAEITLKTLRTGEKAGTPSSTYQTAVVSMIKLGNDWLVDDLKWK